MIETLPRLRDEVSIRPFDAACGPGRYLVAVDDRHFVVNDAVAALLEATREGGSVEALAQRVSGVLGRPISPAQAARVIREQVPDIVFHPATGKTVEGPLRLRVRLLNRELLVPLLRITARLYARERVLALLSAFALLDVLIGLQLWTQGMEAVAGASIGGVAGLVLAGVLVHEIGHLSACHRYGARHGGLGIGLYWFIPAFYAEVHGAWMLSRTQRAVVDVGGAYFQSLFLLILAAIHTWKPSPTLLMAILCSHFLLLNTLNPVLKFDGYWLLSDLSGSHNLHLRIREAARLWWRRLIGEPSCKNLPRTDGLLVASFGALAATYFGYVVLFMGLQVAHACARLSSAWGQGAPWWNLGLRGMAVALLAFVALGVATMLARAIREIVSPGRATGERRQSQVHDAVA